MRDDIWRYATDEPGSQEWELLDHLERARAFLGAAAVGGEIYIVGGYDGQRELDLAEVYAPATGVRRMPRIEVIYSDTGWEYTETAGWASTLRWCTERAASYGYKLHVVKNPHRTYLEEVQGARLAHRLGRGSVVR